jgi:hypothetical protein
MCIQGEHTKGNTTMEINLSNNGLNNIGAGREALDAAAIGIGQEAKVGSGVKPQDAVTITNAPRGVSSAEPVFDVPDSALSRDDALGKLVTAAFNFQPPPMPAFTD